MAKQKGSLIPMRGSVEDWGPGKQQRNLEKKEAYARRMMEQGLEGPPDFTKLLALGAPPKPRAEAKKKTTKGKAKKTKGGASASKRAGRKKSSKKAARKKTSKKTR